MNYRLVVLIYNQYREIETEETIDSVSKTSAEDRARRLFRECDIQMKEVVKEQSTENLAYWKWYGWEHTENAAGK